jgi:hypothetical protein
MIQLGSFPSSGWEKRRQDARAALLQNYLQNIHKSTAVTLSPSQSDFSPHPLGATAASRYDPRLLCRL